MSKSINLLPNKNKKGIEDDGVLVILRRLSIFALVAVVFCSLILFALNYDTTLPSLRRQENTDLTNLSLLHSKTGKVLFIKERLQNISTIMNSRSTYDSLLNQINTMLPGDITVGSFDISKKTMTLVLSSHSLASLSNLLDTMTDMVNNKQTFKTLAIDDLVADGASGKYSLSVKVGLL